MLLKTVVSMRAMFLALLLLGAADSAAQDTLAPKRPLRPVLVSASDDVSRDELLRALECRSLAFPVHSLSRSLRISSCALVAAAKAAVADGRAANLGVASRDTSKIELAMTSRMLITDPNGRELRKYASVTLNIRGIDYSLAFEVEQGRLLRILKSERLELPLSEKDQ